MASGCAMVGAMLAAAVVLASAPSWAQSAPTDGPRAGDRIAGGVGVLVTSVLLGGGVTGYLLGAVPGVGGLAGGSAFGVASVVGLAVGIGEIVTGARERSRPVAFGPDGLTVRF